MPAGRPRKPTHLKALAGTLQPCRTNPAEPTPAALLPTPPDWLSARARAYWAEVGAVLLSMNVCTAADGPALQLLTEALAEWGEARQAVQARGLTYETATATGGTMRRPSPEVAIAADAWRRAMTMLTQFGLTPASRAKVSALPDEDASDPWAELLAEVKG